MTRIAGPPPLAVRRIGSGAPVVCLHAIGHDAEDFVPLAERFADRCEFFLVDARARPLEGGRRAGDCGALR